MDCPMCSMRYDEEGRALYILDVPRYITVQKPCLNCGAGAIEKPAVPRRPTPVADAVARGKYRRDVRRMVRAVARESASLPA